MSNGRIYNFSAGPSMLPQAVLERAQSEMLNWNGSGMSVMEMSHRSKVYDAIICEVEAKLRSVMGIPDGYKVLFLQGGATLQFAMAPMNLIGRTGVADYVLTGQFSSKAAKEAEKYGRVNIAASSKDGNFTYIPRPSDLVTSPDAAYLHYCMNNTIFGTKWDYIPDVNAPLVCDVSSCILSEPIDVSRFGLLYAGAQKNMAPAGLTVVIYDGGLEMCPPSNTPAMLDYALMAKNSSMYNTPSTYNIYMLGLVLDWIDGLGGLAAMQKLNADKAALLYDTLENSKLFTLTADRTVRSMMNVTFRCSTEELDAAFCKGAEAAGLVSIKGHRDVGGMRASIYNAMPREGVEALVEFIKAFERDNG